MEDWLTIKEAAALLRLSEHTVRDQVRDGKIPSVKLGHRTVRVRRAEIEKLLPPPNSPITGGQGAGQGVMRRRGRVSIGEWLVSVIEGEGSAEEKLDAIHAFAAGLVAE